MPATLRLTALILALAAFGSAQPAGPVAMPVPWPLDSSDLTNNGPERTEIWSAVVYVPPAGSLRLAFDAADLGSDDDSIVITGIEDGQVQHLDRLRLKQWRNTTAWFNGPEVLVSVRLAPGSTGRIVIREVLAGIPPPPVPEAVCGNDDRVPSTDGRACRIVDWGWCSAFLVNDRSTFASAGHCHHATATTVPVAEFNVPWSTIAGALVHPPVQDQFPVDQSSVLGNDQWNGDDWEVGRLHPNSSGQTAAARQPWFTIAGAHPAVNDTVRVTGYGSDDTPDPRYSGTQQTDTGPFVFVNANYFLGHRADMTAGNSGCAVIVEATGQAIGINTHDGCTSATEGSNKGTSLLKPEVQNALTQISGCAALHMAAHGAYALPCTPVIFDIDTAGAGSQNRWSVVAVSSPSDWDIGIGGAASASGGNWCDYLIGNGHLGAIAPVSGTMWRFAGADPATGQWWPATTISVGTPHLSDWAAPMIVQSFEFEITTAGPYTFGVHGDPSLLWEAYAPGTTNGWRGRHGAGLKAIGSAATSPVSSVWLDPGWHVLVVFRDGGPGSVPLTSLVVSVAPTVATLALTAGSPQAVANAWQPFSITPVTARWNVVGVASNSDWDIFTGPARSVAGGGAFDFVLADANAGAVSPVEGSLHRYSGTAGAVVEHQSGSVSNLPGIVPHDVGPGSALRVLEFFIAGAGAFDVNVIGDPSLEWRLFAPAGTAAWRSRSDALAAGAANGQPAAGIALGPGWHALVISHANGPAGGGGLPFVASLCPSAAPIHLPSPGFGMTPAPCQPFTIAPQSGSWNAVGVRSDSDWDIGMGIAFSQYGGASCDFVIADGHAGAVSPVAGTVNRYSGTSGAFGQFARISTLTLGSTAIVSWIPGDVLWVFEFNITTAGSYDLFLMGASERRWSLIGPGAGPGWRTRSDASYAGFMGVPLTAHPLPAGWHAIVVFQDGGGSVPGQVTVNVSPTPNPVPVLTSISPSSVMAGVPAFALAAHGSSFVPGAVARWWNGSPLATAFVSSTELSVTIPASLVATGIYSLISVENPPPGGGTSSQVQFTVFNPAPVLTSINPATATAGGPPFTLTLAGSGFNSLSLARWNGSGLATTFGSSNQILATVPASLIANPGTASVTVFTTLPGGGTTSPRTFTVGNPVPVLASLSPASVIAGGSAFTLNANGSSFTSQSRVRWNGAELATTLVSANQLTAPVAAALIAAPGTATVQVYSPAPGGGTSASIVLPIHKPMMSALAPASIAILGPASPPVPITVTGQYFLPGSTIHANGVALATTFVSATQILGSVGPGIPQSQRRGAIAVAVANGPAAFSNARALVVGGGQNQGTVNTWPFATPPGTAFALVLEGGAAFQPVSLFADLGNVAPLWPWPDPAAGMVLAVSPIAGSPGPLVTIVDGIGLYGPAMGTTCDATGTLLLPGLVAPSPPWGVTFTAQGLYLDSTSPLGFRLCWARWPVNL